MAIEIPKGKRRRGGLFQQGFNPSGNQVRIFERQSNVGDAPREEVLDFEKILYPNGEIIWLFNRDRTQIIYGKIDKNIVGGFEIKETIYHAQTFTVGRTEGENWPFVFNKVSLVIGTGGGTTNDIIIELLKVDGARKPTGSPISTGIILTGDILPDDGNFAEIEMSEVELENSTEYAIIVKTTGDINNYGWNDNDEQTGLGSLAWRTINTGATWSSQASTFPFIVEGY